ncbi:DsbA family oxidoreductase [Rhizohabitans arisaemae]|uniref:DsbA family oxidoreductase n=1 Tax=Rhizohabitans arisaemae TaxID=2720610 RepID=UPI0024B1051C|nr:DsbA family oxidoreductase [Rhizohabitans arisaemae]
MKIEVFADVLCPWCYIGKRRLAAALAELGGPDAPAVVWRAFELDPGASRVPGPTAAEAMAEWWGEKAPERVALIGSTGAAEGLELNLHLARPVSTFDAHRLGHLAGRRGRADEVLERLLRAYHTEGLNVADHDVLARLGEEAGLDGGEVRAMLSGDAHAEDVAADRRRAAELGVTGVPSLVIGGAPPVSGVRPVAELRRLLESAVIGTVRPA